MPVTILAILSVILIIVYITEGLFMQVNMHMCIRDREGMASGTRICMYDNREFIVTEEYKGIARVIQAEDAIRSKGGLMLPDILEGNIGAGVYAIDEKKTIRNKDFFSEILF